MKKLLLLLFLPLVMQGQTATENYIKTTTYKVPTPTIITAPTPAQAAVNVTYFDALGRPIQQVAAKQSASGFDIVTPFNYDSYGRQPREYLPFPKNTATMGFDPNAIANGQAYYTATYTPNGQIEQDDAFSEKAFDASPLNRVTEQGAPGADWKVNPMLNAAHSMRFEYLANNTTADAVKLFKITPASINASGYYPTAITQSMYTDNQLYKNVVKDENWVEGTSGKNNTTEQYTDREGHLVLKRTYNAGVAHDTYFVYDIFGNLTYVIPPLAAGSISQATLDGLCYQYRYDSRNRPVEKKLPGKQWEFIVYDLQDRVVATGPSFTPFGGTANGWLITKYDGFKRPVYTGWYSGHAVSAATRVTLQGLYNGLSVSSEAKTTSQTLIDNVGVNYSNSVFPTANFNLLTISYYDDYNFPNPPVIPTTVLTDGTQPVYYNNTTRPKGLPTGSWVRVLTGLPTAERPTIPGTSSYILYDLKGRPVRTYSTNYLGGFTKVDSKLDFTGKVLYTETTHGRLAANSTYIKDIYTYTDQDRPLAHIHQIGTAGIPQLLSKNEYNEMGQLKSKRVGGTDVTAATYFQKVDYSYNIRGWLKGINDFDGTLPADPKPDLFSFKINYGDNNRANTAYEVAVPPLYNGNISETFWKTANDNVKRKYGYQYDNLNRLSSATYQKPAVGSANSYSEAMDYDKNGNIQHLSRTGEYDDQSYSLTIDNLTYTYDAASPNQLLKVSDPSLNPNGFKDGTNTGDDYKYDPNGNMTSDLNKGITAVSYNHLNLPVKITFANATTVEYLYDALGTKLEKKIPSANTAFGDVLSTEYLDGFQYADGVLNFFPTSEGYVKVTVAGKKTTYNYVFNYTDHLGNVRVSYGADAMTGEVKILEENNYYPFGLRHRNYNMTKLEYDDNGGLFPTVANAKGYKYKFNGKEWQDELGMNVYDYGARIYSPDAPHFWQIDPKAEKFYDISPYVYVADDPVNAIDPDGKDIIFLVRGENGAKDQSLNYRNGNFYHENGKRYNPGKESLSPTMYKVLSAYRKIEKSNDKILKSQLNKLETSKQKHYIEKSPNGENAVTSLNDDKSDFGIPTGTQTEFDFDVESGKDVFETVVHEMRHQFDHDIGNMEDNSSNNDENDPAEIRAVYNENRANDILGKKHRTTYGNKIDPKKLKNPPNNKQVEDVKN